MGIMIIKQALRFTSLHVFSFPVLPVPEDGAWK